jgi:hypothetical protein
MHDANLLRLYPTYWNDGPCSAYWVNGYLVEYEAEPSAAGSLVFSEEFNNSFDNSWSGRVGIAPFQQYSLVTSLDSLPYSFASDGQGLLIRKESMREITGSYLESTKTVGAGIELIARVKVPKEPQSGEIQFVVYLTNAETNVAAVGIALHNGCTKTCVYSLIYGGQGFFPRGGGWEWDTWQLLKIRDVPNVGLTVGVYSDAGVLQFETPLGMQLGSLGNRFRVGFGVWTGYDGVSVQGSLVDYIKACSDHC